MARTFIGGIVAGLILFAIGWVFFQSPLSSIGYTSLPDAQGAAVQTSLAQNLTQTGTGTYRIPNPNSDEGARLYTRGPIATVDYNTSGYSPTGMSGALGGLVIAIGAGMLIAFGLGAVARGRDYPELARLVVFFSVGVSAWVFLSAPFASHFGWRFWIYAFVAESVSFIAAGLAVARWFLPHGSVGARAAPAASEQEP